MGHLQRPLVVRVNLQFCGSAKLCRFQGSRRMILRSWTECCGVALLDMIFTRKWERSSWRLAVPGNSPQSCSLAKCCALRSSPKGCQISALVQRRSEGHENFPQNLKIAASYSYCIFAQMLSVTTVSSNSMPRRSPLSPRQNQGHCYPTYFIRLAAT